MKVRLLVIGYGNELRGDDGVGPWVARSVADWQVAGVEAVAVHQYYRLTDWRGVCRCAQDRNVRTQQDGDDARHSSEGRAGHAAG